MQNRNFYEVVTYCPHDSKDTKAIRSALRKIGIKTIHINISQSLFEFDSKEKNILEDRIDFQVSEDKLIESVKAIKDNHSYKLPAITWQSIEGTNETMAWLEETMAYLNSDVTFK